MFARSRSRVARHGRTSWPFSGFAEEVWADLSEPTERIDRDICMRRGVARTTSRRPVLIRLVGVMPFEQHDKWAKCAVTSVWKSAIRRGRVSTGGQYSARAASGAGGRVASATGTESQQDEAVGP